uniref:ATP synthase F0 subunit 8 n=1 Tax=Schoutedenia ralumensis TaxID=1064595 RepID=A0A6M5UBZ3_9HEMI|nr:ATP synthase F0 subunit 8 [Schoutedenia ralumensis]
MPQMAPINWLLMFIYFLTMLYLNMNLIFFIFLKNFKIKKMTKIKIKNYNKFI